MPALRIATIAGDGIGPTVIGEAEQVINALDMTFGGVSLEYTSLPNITTARALENGIDRTFGESTRAEIRGHDAVLFGALGRPDLPKEQQTAFAKHVLIDTLREGFGNNVNYRPARLLYPGQQPPLEQGPFHFQIHSVSLGQGGVEIQEKTHHSDSSGRWVDVKERHSYDGWKEAISKALSDAASRGETKIAVPIKHNVLTYAHGQVLEIVRELQGEYPNIQITTPLCDAFLDTMVRFPSSAPKTIVTDPTFAAILKRGGDAVNGVDESNPRRPAPADWNIAIFRENFEDVYIFQGNSEFEGQRRIGVQNARHSEPLIRANISATIAECIRRGLDSFTVLHLDDVHPQSSALWKEIGQEMGTSMKLQVQFMHGGEFFRRLLTNPAALHGVYAARNLLGDLLSDGSAGIIGGMGLAPSHSFTQRDSKFPGIPATSGPTVSESVGGSAISPRGDVLKNPNPIATFDSLALLLRGHDEGEMAERLEGAIRKTLEQGIMTPDLKKPDGQPGTATTEEFTTAVTRHILNSR